jgi:transposase
MADRLALRLRRTQLDAPRALRRLRLRTPAATTARRAVQRHAPRACRVSHTEGAVMAILREMQDTIARNTAATYALATAIQRMARQEIRHMAALDDQIAQLTADVAAEAGAVQSAVTMLSGIGALISDAVAAALAAGATPAQLQALSEANLAIATQTRQLADAVAANAPPAPPPAA